jgi:hypothetical protein
MDSVDPVLRQRAIDLIRLLTGVVDFNHRGFPWGYGYLPLLTIVSDRALTDLMATTLAAGANPNTVFPGDRSMAECDARYTALAQAVIADSVEAVHMLLDAGADPNLPAHAGMTPLQFAVRSSPEIVRMLLAAGADPLARSDIGETPLILALEQAERGKPNSAEILAEMRRVASASLSKSKTGVLTVRSRKGAFDPSTDRGLSALRRYYKRGTPDWAIDAVRAPIDKCASALVARVPGARWEKDVAKRAVKDGSIFFPLLRFVGSDWTIIPRILGGPARGELREQAQNLANDLGAEVVHILGHYCEQLFSGRDPNVFPPMSTEEDPHSAKSDREYARRTAANDEKLDTWLAEHGLTLPPMEIGTDGLCPRITILGVPKNSVERVDIVVLREWPDGAPH